MKKIFCIVVILLGVVALIWFPKTSFVTADNLESIQELDYSRKELLDQWMPDKNLQKSIAETMNISIKELTKEKLKELHQFGTKGKDPINRRAYGETYRSIKNWKGFEYAENLIHFEILGAIDEDFDRIPLPPKSVRDKVNSLGLISGVPKKLDRAIPYFKENFQNLTEIYGLPSMAYTSYSDQITLTEENFDHFEVTMGQLVSKPNLEFNNPDFEVYLDNEIVTFRASSIVLNYAVSKEKDRFIFKLKDTYESDFYDDTALTSVSKEEAYLRIQGTEKTIPTTTALFYKENFGTIDYNDQENGEHGISISLTLSPILRINFE